jgi:translation initiation factor 2B subunit (eIF-2B alpha/beta/delta family)
MINGFLYDVFLSYSSRDKGVVRPIAERLQQDGLKVWFDEWMLKPGDNIQAKIDEGLEHSRVLVLCMSENAFGSDWAKLETGTFRFRDPMNKELRFVPLRLDDASIPGSLEQFLYINWPPDPAARYREYAKLLEACRRNKEFDRFQKNCLELLKQRTSERAFIEGLLNHIDTLLKTQKPDRHQSDLGILNTISAIIDQRRHYPLLEKLRSEVDNCLSEGSSTAERLRQCINGFRSSLFEVLQALAINGAKHIDAGDTILLYAHSQSVLAAINKWLLEHPTERLELIFAQCTGKPIVENHVFGHAIRSANCIEHANVRMFVVLDSAIGAMIQSGGIKKVFFGVHQWGWLSNRRVWFTNTQGTLSIATLAKDFGVPIYVLAETTKTRTEPGDSQDYEETCLTIQSKCCLPLEHRVFGADEIDSKMFPLILITEQGGVACADHGLRKRNRVLINRDGISITKTTPDKIASTSEKTVLQVLGDSRLNMELKFQTPRLLPADDPLGATVPMLRIPGIRMHDLIATLNISAERYGGGFAQNVEVFRNISCEWAIEDVCTWQSYKIQESLRKGFRQDGDIYEFEDRLKEAISYVWSIGYGKKRINHTLLSEIEELASHLKARASVFLRDANPKNQILEIGKLLGSNLPERCNAVGYFPLVDDQWFDPIVAELLLNRIPHRVSWENVRSHIWQVDFELSSRRTTKEDDLIHILASEVFSLDYDHIVERITERLSEVRPEHVHETMFFRSFRAWARRLFYYHEEPKLFATRYRHESLSHHYSFARTAARKLRTYFGDKLLSFIESVDEDLGRRGRL